MRRYYTTMINTKNYFGKWAVDANVQNFQDATELCSAVTGLMIEAEADGVICPINPVTNTQVSGTLYGGFRPPDCPEGAPHSAHKVAKAVDVYDPLNALDDYIDLYETPNGGNTLLEKYGLYREHPSKTVHWCHLSIKAPPSGHRTFYP